MAITNNNVPGIDVPQWEQLVNAMAASVAGSSICDDNRRFRYYLISATSFWRYDCWAHTWQQLANPPAGTVAAGTCLRYLTQLGSQINGVVTGSVAAFQAAGASVSFYIYDCGLNTWSGALSVTNVPGGFTTDGRLVCPEPALNAFQGGYHNAQALNVITTSATANVGAITISVTALPLALPAKAVINFGTLAAPLWAALTAPASAGATSLSVTALVAQIPSGSVGYFYSDMFLFGNNAQVVYRYNFAANAWYTTSANSGNPALVAVGTNMGAGCVAAWLPGSGNANALNRLVLVCGGASTVIREYDLATNTVTVPTYYPASETFTTGSASGVRVDKTTGKNKSLVLQKDITGRCYEFNFANYTMTPLVTQYLVASSTALVGDRMTILTHSGIEFLYFIPSTSSYHLRTPLFFDN